MLQLHSLRIKSASTTATQRTQHFQRQFETLPLKKCIFGEGADWAFGNEESKPDTSEIEDFGSRSCCSYLDIQLDWFNAWAQLLSHLQVIILVSLCALQIIYHIHSWDSFFHLLWWTDEVSNFVSAAYTDEPYFYIQMTLQCREIIQFYLIINNYSQLLFFQLID